MAGRCGDWRPKVGKPLRGFPDLRQGRARSGGVDAEARVTSIPCAFARVLEGTRGAASLPWPEANAPAVRCKAWLREIASRWWKTIVTEACPAWQRKNREQRERRSLHSHIASANRLG